MPDLAGLETTESPARIGEKQHGLTVPVTTVFVLPPQMPHWLFRLILREL